MAAKLLTTEEKNYLRSIYLTFVIGTDAVMDYFNQLHPPADLVAHLSNDKLAFESLKKDGIISREMWGKMYPRPGQANPTSAEFDLTTLIFLLREITPKVKAPRRGFDQLPDRADKSPGACLANIKWYRNFLAHADKKKLGALSSTTFTDLFTQVEMAIQVLGNNQYSSKITDAKKLNIDNDVAEILETMMNYENQFQDLQEGVNKNSSQSLHQHREIKELQEKFSEIEIDQMEEKISHKQEIDQMSKNMNELKETLEKKVKEQQKPLAATQTKHGKQIQTLEQQASSMKKKQEDQKKEWTEKHNAITSRTEELEKKTNENKEKTNKLAEIQTMQHESIQTIGQEQEKQRKEVKELKENQQFMPNYFLGYGEGIYPNIVKKREIDNITLPESFEEIEEVTRGADALRDNGILILVGIKGSGKSTIGKAIIKQYCEGNPDYDMIQLSTTTESDINYCDGLGFFRPSNQVVVFLDDLFGRVPSTYAFKEHLMLLNWVYEKQGGIKILSTVQAETKACVEELFASDHGDAILISAEIINLHSAIYPRRDMLIKSGFDEERSDNIIQQIKETGVQERIGFPALVSILKENQELGDELFINPGNVFMNYLSSLKKGSDQDKMYFVILIHVLMTGKVFEENQFSKILNTSDKKSMFHIATTIFGNTLEFQKYESSIESIIDEKEDGILMSKDDPLYPYYYFKEEITTDFIFQYYKAEGIEKILTTCSLNCIVSYFRPLPDKADEPLVCIDINLYQRVASHIISIIKEDLKTRRVPEVIMSVKTLCMSPLLQEESFLMVLMIECDQLSIPIFVQTDNFRLGYDKIVFLKAFHLPSLLLHQSCRQLSLTCLMKEENVKVVKMIFQKVSDSREDSVEICQTINKLVKFSVEELCKENIDKNVVLELLWKFIMDKKVDCEYNDFLMNAWRNQCSKTVIWLQENVREPNCLQMEQCFLNICLFIGVHKTSWILEHNPKSGQNKISMYKVFNQVLTIGRRPLMEDIWQLEERILEDYKHDEQLHTIESPANLKKMFANKVMEFALNEVCLTSIPFMWAYDAFKPHQCYFDKKMVKKIEKKKTGKHLRR